VRIAVLDDYQGAAHRYADWSGLAVTFFADHVADPDELVARLEPYEAVFAMRERTAFPAAVFAGLPRLRLLVTAGMANAAIDLAAAAAAGVTVCGTGMSGSATVEMTWALILGLTRHVPEEDRALREGRWQTTVGTALAGRRLGVVGFGRLGSAVAAVGQAFGMHVVAWSQHVDPARARAAGVEPVDKAELFRTADVITIHYKLGARSVGLVDAQDLALVKPTAFLVNTSRGPIVDTDALVTALEEGRLAGAALDVFDPEPLPADHPLRRAPRTILTPHLGYVVDDGYARIYADAVEDIRAFAAGSPIRVL
jgi:phosphoglycerate dehydrogenase-like enzyme